MSYALIIVGVMLLIASIRDMQGTLFTLLRDDFIGMHSYVFWLLSILGIGAVGYVPKMKGLSDGFLILVFLMLFISNKGFFNQFMSQISGVESTQQQTIQNAPQFNVQDEDAVGNVNVSGGSGGSGGSSVSVSSGSGSGSISGSGLGLANSQTNTVDSNISYPNLNLSNLPQPTTNNNIDPNTLLNNVYAGQNPNDLTDFLNTFGSGGSGGNGALTNTGGFIDYGGTGEFGGDSNDANDIGGFD
jgi:hypothetical protein